MIGGGDSLAGRAVNQQLAMDIAVSRRKRSRRWRLQFTVMWVAIIAALIIALLLTTGINSEFIQRWTPFILLGVPITLFVAIVSIFFAVVPGRPRRARPDGPQPVSQRRSPASTCRSSGARR